MKKKRGGWPGGITTPLKNSENRPKRQYEDLSRGPRQQSWLWCFTNDMAKRNTIATTVIPIHEFMHAALAIKRKHRISHGDIKEVTCFVSELAIPIICLPVDRKLSP